MNALLEPSLCKCCNEHPMEPVREGVWACRKCDMLEEMLIPREVEDE